MIIFCHTEYITWVHNIKYITPTHTKNNHIEYTDIEGTRLSSEISSTRTDLTM
jgi:hypothetical protein